MQKTAKQGTAMAQYLKKNKIKTIISSSKFQIMQIGRI